MPKTAPIVDSSGSARDATRRRPVNNSEEELCQRFLTVALCQANRCGLYGESAEDCALGFVAHTIAQAREADGARITDAWLWRCAINWVRNFCRGQRRRKYHERCYTDLVSQPFNEYSSADQLRSLTEDNTDSVPGKWSPEHALLCRELQQYLLHAIMRAGLTPAQQQLLLDYYAWGESTVEISCRYCRTANAIRQELWVLRSRIRGALTDMGINREEAISYLASLASLRIEPFLSAHFLVAPSEPQDNPTPNPSEGITIHSRKGPRSHRDKSFKRPATAGHLNQGKRIQEE